MGNDQIKLWKFLPLTFSMETVGGISTPLALRGTPLPISRKQVFSTVEDNQESVKINVFFGESPLAEKNKYVTSFEIKELPKEKKGTPQIAVSFDIAKSLDIKISAIEERSKKSSSIEIKNAEIGLTDETIQQILTKAEIEKNDDNKKVNEIETFNTATNTISQAESFIQNNQSNSSQRDKVEKSLAELGLVLESNNLELIREKTEELKESMSSFGLFGSNNLFDDFFKSYTPPKKTSNTTESKSNLSVEKNYKDVGKIFGGCNFTLDPNLCFVLMPFGEDLKPIYDDHIVGVAKAKGLTPQRADEIYSIKLITWDIWEKLNRARIIVADLTNKNPNVFYELGLAHAIGKDVIIISQKIEDVPFDLKALRCIIYEYKPRGMKKLEEILSATIDEILRQN